METSNTIHLVDSVLCVCRGNGNGPRAGFESGIARGRCEQFEIDGDEYEPKLDMVGAGSKREPDQTTYE